MNPGFCILPALLALAGPTDLEAWASKRIGSPDPVARNAARRILAQSGPGPRPGLLEALDSPAWRDREGALTALAWSPEPPPAGLLARLVGDPDWPVRRALALLWGWHRLGRELPMRLLADPFPDVRAAAVLALAAQPGPPVRELVPALVDRAAAVREAAWRVLVCAPKPPVLAEVPGSMGERARRRALRALATRPLAGQTPVLREFLDSSDASLGERLIALQALLSLGEPFHEGGALVMAGLQDPSPAVRTTAIWTGLLLPAEEVIRLAPQGFTLSNQDSWESFLKVAGHHGARLAPLLPDFLSDLASLRAGQRGLVATGLALGVGGWLGSLLLEVFDAATAERLARVAALPGPQVGPEVGEWVLAHLEGAPGSRAMETLFPLLYAHAGRPEVRAFLLERLPGLPAWRQKELAREILKHGGAAPEALLEPLETPGRLERPAERRDYLSALEGFPARPRFLELVSRLLEGDSDPGVRLVALRILTNLPGGMGLVERGLLSAIVAWPEASESLQRACLEVLAWAGDWEELEGLLARLEPARALRLRRQLVPFVRDKGLRGGNSLLERWAGESGGGKLAIESLQALAWLGRGEAARRLVRESGGLGEAELVRTMRALKSAPEDIALAAIEAWAAPDRPDYFRETACRLAQERRDLGVRGLLEAMVREAGSGRIQAAALAALVARGEGELPAALLPELVLAPPGSEEEGILAEVLDAIGKGGASWAVPTLWRAVLERHLRHPLQEVERTLDPSQFASRSALGRARLLCGHLYTQEDEAVARGLETLLSEWEGSPGLMLLGGDLVHCLLDEAREQGRRPARPVTGGRLARLGLGIPPRGQPLRLVSCLTLAAEAEAAGRLAEGAALYEEALLILLMGEVDGRTQEHLMGVTDPAAGRFPISRLAALPNLLRARAHREAGREQEADAELAEALERGGVDLQVRRQVEAATR